ncbi:MAG: phage terminase large subunit, partial [Bacillota bacterium]|nr:phage terminase large subunit [Bacillota bacterium]
MQKIWTPQPKQTAFLERPEYEAFYGGAAGGGKSDSLLMEALRQVHIPHYRGLILRKTYPELSELIAKSRKYYQAAFPAARYNDSKHLWTFPSGAEIYFGSLHHPADKIKYQGRSFDFIGFDELTHFTWEEYSYLFSRNRPSGQGTRVYIRATGNPGGIGHGWVKSRFITAAP